MNKIFFFFCTCLLWISCLKQAPETPPALQEYDPLLPVNCHIDRLIALTTSNGPVRIDSDWTIAAIVTADDRSGNLYKQLVVQDSGGGIALLLNSAQLYRQFPAGRKIYIHLKGLYVGLDHGLPELGSIPAPDNNNQLQVSAISAKQLGEVIIPATLQHTILPITLHASDLQSAQPLLANRLVTIQDVELANPEADNVYAEAQHSTNITLAGCDGSRFVVRSSGYATFASAATPHGGGSITGIYSVYDKVVQLVIRDTNDVHMNGNRCSGTAAESPKLINLATLRGMYNGKDTTIANCLITGTVTSDAASGNNGSEGNIILQQGGKGIIVYFGSSAAAVPQLGDSIMLTLAGTTLTNYNGALELKNIKTNKVQLLASGKTVTPQTITIAKLNAAFSAYESVLVSITGARLSGSGNYSGSRTLSDGTGDLILFTSSTASFAGDKAPTITKTFQGIATPYGVTKELKLRNPSIDVF